MRDAGAEGIVIMKRQFDIGIRTADAIAKFFPSIDHIINHGAVPFLRHRAIDQLTENPETGHDLVNFIIVNGQIMHDAKSEAAIQSILC